jgi:putative glutamine amidotransferase
MHLEVMIRNEQDRLTWRLASALGGDLHAAEDVVQEAFVRAWQRLPPGLDHERQRAWLRRTARNLALDEVRRRLRRPAISLEDAGWLQVQDTAEPDAAREALGRLSAHERFVLLLRFQGGFSHAEIAGLLNVSEEAARKRVTRARATFLRTYRAARAGSEPLILLLARDESIKPYVRWLQGVGARVRNVAEEPSERELALADGLVLTGSGRDVHSALYGESPRALRGETDLAHDRQDLAVVKAALALDLPIVGICRGHQLLNIASGGTLFQDLLTDGATANPHETGYHRLETRAQTTSRGMLGRCTRVHSGHHQAVRRLGGRLRVTASSPDGLVEMIERTDRRFVLGLQWHPEGGDIAGDRVGEALVKATLGRAA